MHYKKVGIVYKDKTLGSVEFNDVLWMSIGSGDIVFQMDSTDEVMRIPLGLIQLITID